MDVTTAGAWGFEKPVDRPLNDHTYSELRDNTKLLFEDKRLARSDK